MDATLRTMMDGVVDYAGLFPPASLDLARAVTEYAHLREGPEAWVLGRFVVSSGRLAEARTLGAEHPASDGRPWRFSVLIGGGETETDVLGRMRSEGDILAAVRGRGGVPRPFVVEAMETRLPGDVQASLRGDRVRSFVVRTLEALEDAIPSTIEFYLEGPTGEAEPASDKALVEGVSGVGGSARVGVKIRCGGSDASSFPSVERVASILTQCKAAAVPVKFTAGLHWPIRRKVADQWNHGFVNVLGTAVLLHAGALDPADAAACVGETEAAAFSFDDGTFSWRGRRASLSAVTKARKSMVVGVGSASFSEPIQGLRTLGWWKD
jgi:hypothetical protein